MANRPALDADGLEEVRARIDDKQSLTEIAAALGVSYKTVQKAAKTLGLKPATRPRPVHDQAKRQRAVELYQAGKSCSKVSRELGVSEPWVVEQVKKAGIALRSTAKLADTASDIVARYQAGESTGELVADLGVSDSAISNRLKHAGVSVHRAGWKIRLHDLRDDAFAFSTGHEGQPACMGGRRCVLGWVPDG
ncbi:helix-turn-helix domain-containing protein [Kineosporia babensis]|uniref:Helix-turn-helix domain-containing protein n=1 Tax=Kineosporia babensis TaxID=499548 RepID=A0A9X1NM90_9ACTN|nr:helix-turn-helix domain-containing protein [Kineosporia babensis]MCD5316159.1 helix-turn-helix domain-containing protein [Kineosporia babensis]